MNKHSKQTHKNLVEDHAAIITQLTQFDSSQYSFIQSSLRTKLLNEISTRKTSSEKETLTMIESNSSTLKIKWAMIPLVVILIMLIINFTFPPIRIYAQEFFSRLLGYTLITNQPSRNIPVSTVAKSQISIDQLTPIPWESNRLLSLEEASLETGFTIFTPAYIPEGYSLAYLDVLPPDELNPYTAVLIIYQGGLQNQDQIRTISIRQLYNPDGKISELPIGDATIQEIQVRNQNGIWLEEVATATSQKTDGSMEDIKLNMLGWAESGFEFWINSNDNLSLEQSLQIAESIQMEQAPIETNLSGKCPTPFGANIEAAKQQTGFNLFIPTYLPDRFCLSTVEIYQPDENVPDLTTAIIYRLQYSGTEDITLVISQNEHPGNLENIAVVLDTTPVQLRNTEAVFIQQSMEPYLNILMWDENGYSISISSNSDLSQAELMRIANALTQN
jgi:hypothetical protein